MIRVSRNVRDAAAESVAAPALVMPHDAITRIRLNAAAAAASITIDTAEALVRRHHLEIRRSGRLVFVSVGDLLAAARK